MKQEQYASLISESEQISENQLAAPIQASIEQADRLFRQGKIEQAISLYQQIIQTDLERDYQIDGLGNHAQTLGYYQWFIPKWYDQNKKMGTIKGSPYDALSLCYAFLKNNQNLIQNGIAWYRRMKRKNQNYQIVMGCGHILFKKGLYQQAIRMYNKVIDLKPTFEPAYQSKALIYFQYKRVQKQKAVMIANTLLSINPKNLWGLFIIARNITDVDERIQKLKQLHIIHPKYARAVNQIGIAFGGSKKMYDEAIEWYKKCIDIVPQYASCYNNIGVNYQLKKQYLIAIEWYHKAIQKDRQYKAPHKNLTDIYDILKYSDQQILGIIKNYSQIQPVYFNYYLGLSYYDDKKCQTSIKWYYRALQIQSDIHHKVYNSIGISYDDLKQYDKAQQFYLKCIKAAPKYHSAYYNLAIMYKNKGNQQKAVQFYHQAIKVNPGYSYAHNNLGNIHKNRGQYQQAIECYKKAVQFLSTYTLAYANMGVCYLKTENYQQAFYALQRAKEILSADNNNLNQNNKAFLKETLDKFDKEGQKWRNSPLISKQQKSNLNSLLNSFESTFKSVYTGDSAIKAEDKKILKNEIIDIINLVFQDKFLFKNMTSIYSKVRKLFFSNQEYFHILPQLFSQFFWYHLIQLKQKLPQVQQQMYQMIENLSETQLQNYQQKLQEDIDQQLELRHFKSKIGVKINLFEEKHFFNDQTELYKQILHVNKKAKICLMPFTELVQQIREQANGIPQGVSMKFSENIDNQFKDFMPFFQQMFKEQLTSQRLKSIKQSVEAKIRSLSDQNKMTILKINSCITQVWNIQITNILRQRQKFKKQTEFTPSNLIQGKINFHKIHDLFEAVEIAEEICCKHNYEIIQLINRLTNVKFMDILLKIKIKDCVCELRLAVKKDERPFRMIQLLQQLKDSQLGCGFASYFFLSKKVNYHFLQNCKDIIQKLKDSSSQKEKKTVEAASFIVESMQELQ